MGTELHWEKLGRIFPNGDDSDCFGQVPFAVANQHFVRIYFSSRGDRDSRGQYTSFGAYIDICPGSDEQFDLSANAANVFLQAGICGEFDAYGVMPGSLVQKGERTLLFYCGWSRPEGRPYRWRIGVLERNRTTTTTSQSCREVRFSRSSELAACPIVFDTPAGLQMYFLRGDWICESEDTERLESTYLLYAATSENGLEWEVDEHPLLPPVVDFEAQTSATVLKDEDGYHLLFSFRNGKDFRNTPGRGYRLGYAFSADGVTWDRQDEFAGLTTSAEGWDSTMICYPSAFVWRQSVYLLYSGNDFGRSGFGLARLTGGLRGAISIVTGSTVHLTVDADW